MLTEIVTIIFFLTPIFLYNRKVFNEKNSNLTTKFFAVWCFLFVFEYIYAGPASYIDLDDQGDILVPFLVFLDKYLSEGNYTHRMMMGVDLIGSYVFGGEFLSFDLTLVRIFPLWIAIFLHQVVTVALGFFGTYKLLRRGFSIKEVVCVACAALFTVIQYRYVLVTYNAGISWVVLPLVIYICVLCHKDPYYWLKVVALAFWVAASIGIYQGLLPLVATIGAGCVLFSIYRLRVLLASFVIILAVFVNWSESIFGMLQLAPLAQKNPSLITSETSIYLNLFKGLGNHIINPAQNWFITSLFWISFTILLFYRDQLAWRLLAAFFVPVLCLALFIAFPWEVLGLSTVRGVSVSHFLEASVPIAVISSALACYRMTNSSPYQFLSYRPAFPAVLILCCAFGLMGYYKITSLRAHFNYTGQRMYSGAEQLLEFSKKIGPYWRTVSLHNHLTVPTSTMNAAFYGLSSLQSFVHMRPKAFSEYWDAINNRENNREHSVPITRHQNPVEIERYMNLNLLAVANTRYIVSEIALVSDAIRYVDGPKSPPPVYLKSMPETISEKIKTKIQRYLWFIGRFFKPWKVYIYEISGALPRVYSPTNVSAVDDEIKKETLHKLINANGLSRTIIVRNSQLKKLSGEIHREDPSLKIESFTLIPNGYRVKTKNGTRGLVVINANFYPFFKARAGGKLLPIIQVNSVQMAVQVPPGQQNVEITYERPNLITKVTQIIGNMLN